MSLPPPSVGKDDGIPEWIDFFGDPDPEPVQRGDPEFWSEAEDEVAVVDVKKDDPRSGETDDLEPKVEELKKPMKMTTIYVCRPLRRRTNPAVLTALQELVLQMSKVNVPVNAIHSDRAGVQKSSVADMAGRSTNFPYKNFWIEGSWEFDCGAGGEVVQGSDACLLKAAEAAPTDWPMAAAHAAFGLLRKAFPSSRSSSFQTRAFGQTVWFKAKGYRGVEERKADMGAN